ncbi:MAG: site-2 protease family protein [Actinomycetota bacterium]|nr:site-2 protease family protein [Actinomycetota bacterium]
MDNDIRLGSIFGIEIFISYSWFFIFGLVTITLAFGFFPQQFPKQSVAVNIAVGFFASALFFASLLFHELSHSLVANINDIPIKKITLFIFGGMSQMSGEPQTPVAELKMAAAGPASSFFLAGVYFAIDRAMISAGLPTPLYAAFGWLAEINFFLAVFNLAPGFPLDGGRVLRAAIWYLTNSLQRATKIAARAGQGVAFTLISAGVLLFLFGQITGVWLILLGWFLNQAAIASYRQMMVEQSLSTTDVAGIMSSDVETVSPDLTLEELVNHYFLKYRYGRFPVVDNGSLLGVITLHDIKEVPREDWSSVTAGEIVEPILEDMFVAPSDPAVKALVKMAGADIGHLLVVDENKHLAGIVTRTDIIGLIKIRSELQL